MISDAAGLQGSGTQSSQIYSRVLSFVLENGCTQFDEAFAEHNPGTGRLERIVRVVSDPNMMLGSNSFSFLTMAETKINETGEFSDPIYYTVGLKEFTSFQNAAREVATYNIIRDDPLQRLDVPETAGPILGSNGRWYVFVQRYIAPVSVNDFMLSKVNERHRALADEVYGAIMARVLENGEIFRSLASASESEIPFAASYNLLDIVVRCLFEAYPSSFMAKNMAHNNIRFTDKEKTVAGNLFEKIWDAICSHKEDWVYYRNCNGDNQLISLSRIYLKLRPKLEEAGISSEMKLMDAAYDLVLEGRLGRDELCGIIADSITEIDMEKTIPVPAEYDIAEFLGSYSLSRVFGRGKVLQRIDEQDREGAFCHLAKASKRIDNIVNVLQSKFSSRFAASPDEARAVFYSEAEHYRELLSVSFSRLIETEYSDVRWYHIAMPKHSRRAMEYLTLKGISGKLKNSVYDIRVQGHAGASNEDTSFAASGCPSPA